MVVRASASAVTAPTASSPPAPMPVASAYWSVVLVAVTTRDPVFCADVPSATKMRPAPSVVVVLDSFTAVAVAPSAPNRAPPTAASEVADTAWLAPGETPSSADTSKDPAWISGTIVSAVPLTVSCCASSDADTLAPSVASAVETPMARPPPTATPRAWALRASSASA